MIGPRNLALIVELFPALKGHPFPALAGDDLNTALEACREAGDSDHLNHIAEMVGEGDDVGAAWESVAQIIREHRDMRKTLLDLAQNVIAMAIAAETLASEIEDLPEPRI